VKNRRGWRFPWVNGHTSLVLKPGEKKSYRIRFAFVDGYAAVRQELAESGNLGIRVLPSMVVQEDDPVYVEVRSKFEPAVSFLSDNGRVLDKKRLPDRTLLTLSFKGRGQKSVRLTYDGGKWTNLHFYCTANTAELIRARARFIVERQFYENPEDPFGRHHMFLPFDYRIGSVFMDSDEVWEVGGSDEYGFSEPLFLAEKNVSRPDRREVETLEAYVEDCLTGHIQNQETFALRASLYWKERYPSSPWGHWTEERSKESYRTYNYPHVANIYHALYRIGKLYGLTARRQPLEYLRLAYQTCLKWFETGPWKHVGVIGRVERPEHPRGHEERRLGPGIRNPAEQSPGLQRRLRRHPLPLQFRTVRRPDRPRTRRLFHPLFREHGEIPENPPGHPGAPRRQPAALVPLRQ
jgi:hypothetical protein